MALVAVYVITLIGFFAMDFAGLKFVMYPLFERHIGELLREEVQVAVAGSFYCFYVVGVMYFAVLPAARSESVGLALGNGALLGLVAYGTYEFSNMATLKGWAWQMVATDTLWGVALTATSAAIGYVAARALM